MKKIFLFVLTCMISYLSLAGEGCSVTCEGGNRVCCSLSNGDTYYHAGEVVKDF